MMNRFVRLILLATATLAIAACGEQKVPEPAPAAEVTSEPALAPDVINIPPAGVATKLTGKWQSTEDAASILAITADTWTNEYTGDDSVNDVAKWRAFPGTEMLAGSEGLTFTPTATYIEVKSGDNTFFYELGRIEADAFDFFYVSRGNHFSFKRIT